MFRATYYVYVYPMELCLETNGFQSFQVGFLCNEVSQNLNENVFMEIEY